MTSPEDIFEKCRSFSRANELRAANLYPYFMPQTRPRGRVAIINGQEKLVTCSNDYLGLACDPRVCEAAAAAIEQYGAGSTASRVLSGTFRLHCELEEQLADFFGREAAQLFTTGYQANLGTIAALVGRHDTVFCDRENHASILDGCRLVLGTVRKFRHNDCEDLQRLLDAAPERGGRLVVTEGVFSMSGDLPPLAELLDRCRRAGARLALDDAHGIGVLGANGRGTEEYLGFDGQCDLLIGTFSKAFGTSGGFVVGTRSVIDYIKHHARALMFSASASPATLAAAGKALEIIRTEPERRERVLTISARLRNRLRQLGLAVRDGITPIICIEMPDEQTALCFWRRLFDLGVFASPILPPACPGHAPIVRASLSAAHTDEDVDRIVEAFALAAKSLARAATAAS